MGVKVVGLSKMQVTDPHPLAESCYEAGHVLAFAYAPFVESARGLADHDQEVVIGGARCVGGRCYVRTAATMERVVMDVGYLSYGEWRRALALAALDADIAQVWAEPDRYQGLPFYELLNFADNEGVIGADAAADLLADFQRHRDVVPVDEVEFPGITPLPDRWIQGLKLAADGGLLRLS